MESNSGVPPACSTACHGSVSSTCSTMSVATNATRLPSSSFAMRNPLSSVSDEGYPHRGRCNALAADAEVAGDEDDLATRVDARGGVVTEGRAADLAPILGEDVLAVAGARHPGLHRLVDREVRRRPDDVLADGPVAGVALCVVAIEALPEGAPVGRLVGEEAHLGHGVRVLVGCRGQALRHA